MTAAQVRPGQDEASVMHPEPRCTVLPDSQGVCQGWAGPLVLGVGVLPPLPPQEHALPAAPDPAAAFRVPTSPVAEAVPHGHLLRTPIATAPACAQTGQSPSMGAQGSVARALILRAPLAPRGPPPASLGCR